MTKRIIISVLSVVLVIVYAIRVYHINSATYYPIIQKYQVGEEVPIEDDFFNTSNENMNGYSVTVLGTELLTKDEFRKKYNAFDKNILEFSDYVYLVRVRFRNATNKLGENAGINLRQYIIQNLSYINYIERDAYSYVNDFDVLSFSLRYDSDKEVVIPFGIYNGHIDVEKFITGHPELVVSLYPHKKIIKLYD